MNYIDIKNSDGSFEKMELTMIFKLDSINFVIYNDLDRNNYYFAKYKDNCNSLITDLSKNEIEICNKIFNEVINSGIKN